MAPISRTNEDSRENKPLAGGVALVTGGSRGIGRAIAHRLALLGASVSICGRDRAALQESARELAKIGVPLHSQIQTFPILLPGRKPRWVPSPSSSTTPASAFSARSTRKPKPIGISFSIPISRASSSSPALWRLP